ncbi:hypothetical protein BN874_830018 [Candidatus Contendobacter odensis Run_B_J11]|uniref:Uncharacterized protein n=1 Tax=Candidatus Contendobacter odensis Run_B_J11 TaxID=1400861 RepID=A0A7U7GFJ0_9GAMM|nr:hypothetical protein BN874_830018 [Candidatus Contendobacter odensis Run_B_J11]
MPQFAGRAAPHPAGCHHRFDQRSMSYQNFALSVCPAPVESRTVFEPEAKIPMLKILAGSGSQEQFHSVVRLIALTTFGMIGMMTNGILSVVYTLGERSCWNSPV